MHARAILARFTSVYRVFMFGVMVGRLALCPRSVGCCPLWREDGAYWLYVCKYIYILLLLAWLVARSRARVVVLVVCVVLCCVWMQVRFVSCGVVVCSVYMYL